MKNFTTALVFLSLMCTPAGAAPDFTWEAGEVAAKVKVDHDILKIGQYLYISRPRVTKGWNMAKLDLPESWEIESVKVDGRIISVIIKNARPLAITPKNLKKLRTAISKAKRESAASDEQLEGIWRSIANAPPG